MSSSVSMHNATNIQSSRQAHSSSAAARDSPQLQPFSSRAHQSNGGTLQQDGPASRAPAALEQQPAEPRQKESRFGGLKASFSRLREKLHHNGNKLQKRSGPPPERESSPFNPQLNNNPQRNRLQKRNAPTRQQLPENPETQADTSRFTRDVRPQNQGLPQRPFEEVDTSRFTRRARPQNPAQQPQKPDAARALQRPQTAPSQPLHSPPAVRGSRNRLPPIAEEPETDGSARNEAELSLTGDERSLHVAPLNIPGRQAPPVPQRNPLREADDHSLYVAPLNLPNRQPPPIPERNPLRTAERPDIPQRNPLREGKTPPVSMRGGMPLRPVEEEKYADLAFSQLNTMQQRAQRAAEHDTAERKNSLKPQVATLALDPRGKLSVEKSVSDNLRNLLNETIARPGNTYQAHHANDDGSQHLLMDPNGRLISLQGSKTAFVGLTQSEPMRGWKQADPSRTARLLDKTGIKDLTTRSDARIRFNNNESATISPPERLITEDNNDVTRTISLPGAAIHSRLTGVYSHRVEDPVATKAAREANPEAEPVMKEELLREHDSRLYRLDEAKMHWDQVDKHEEKKFGKLTKQANGQLYAVHDKKTLHNLSAATKSEKLKGDISGYAVDSDGGVLVLTKDKKTAKQSVTFLESLTSDKDDHQSVALKLAGKEGADATDFHATAITLHQGRLYAISSNGKLYSSDTPAAGIKELELNPMDEESTARLRQTLGEKYMVEEFLNHGDSHLTALAKDTRNQRHACVMDGQNVFRPQWNLNESLVMDHHEGLLRPRPLQQDIVDLGTNGQIIVYDGKINTFNKNSQRWEPTYEYVDSLKRGHDGQAYALKDGIAARVKVTKKSDAIGGLNHQFIMPQMKSNVSLDLPLVGLHESNKAKAIAPLNAQQYVALTEKGELQFHRNLAGTRRAEKMIRTLPLDGIANYLPHMQNVQAGQLPATGSGATLVDVAVDRKKSLYVLDDQGKVYTLPESAWASKNAPEQPARWQPVELPEVLTAIEHLHNAPDGSLMVADESGRSAILQLAGTRVEANVTKTGERSSAAEMADGLKPAEETTATGGLVPAEETLMSGALSPDEAGNGEVIELRNRDGNANHLTRGETGISLSESTISQLSNITAQEISAKNRWLMQPDYDPEKKLEAQSHRPEVDDARLRLSDTTISHRIGGLTARREVVLSGITGNNAIRVNSRLRDRLSAHLFRPTFATPRPLKTVGYAIQHNWQGREGLSMLYQQQADLHQGMKQLLSQPAAAPAPGNLLERIDQLDSRSFNREFLNTLKLFSEGVTDSAMYYTSLLGQQSGATRADRSETPDFSPSRLRSVTQKMNPYSDDSNLVDDLSRLFSRYPMRAESSSQQMMQALNDKGVVMHHQKANPPMNRKRDPYDDLSLAKSRLILDGLTMGELHRIVGRMEVLSGSNEFGEIKALQEEFRLLHDEIYGENPVRKATGQGFVSHKQLEACYDAIKSMTKAFSKPNHGLHMTTRTVLKAKEMSVDEMTERLQKTLNSLESGENMSFGRSYGGMLTFSVIPGGEVIGIPGLRGNLDRAYNLSFSRTDGGINVNFSRNGGGTGTAFGAIGWNPITQAADPHIGVDMGEHRSIVPSARLGGIISAAIQNQQQNSIGFTLSEGDLHSFLDALMKGETNPQALMEMGTSHKVKNGTTLTFTLDTAFIAYAGGGMRLPLSSEDIATVSGRVLAQAGATVMTAQRERNTTSAEGTNGIGRSDNAAEFLTNFNIRGGLVGGAGLTTNNNGSLRYPLFGVNSTSIALTANNRTKHSMSLDITKAEPVNKQQLDKLIETIGLNFDEPALNKLVQELKDADKEPEKPKTKQSDELKALAESRLRYQASRPAGDRPLSKKDREALEKLEKEASSAKGKERAKEPASPAIPAMKMVARPGSEWAAIAAAAENEAQLDSQLNALTSDASAPESSAMAQARQAAQQAIAENTSAPADSSSSKSADGDKKSDKPEKKDDKLSTFLKSPEEALQLKLTKLLDHLTAMTPENNGQYGVIMKAKDLQLQQQAADLHCQSLNSTEYQSTYDNVNHILEKNSDPRVILNNLFSLEATPRNAHLISGFVDERPALKEALKKMMSHADTQVVVTRELKDGKKLELQHKWLSKDTTPEEIQKLLGENPDTRIKSIALSETDSKSEGINLPLLVTGASSTATVSMSRNQGKISFSYGEDQDMPVSFTMEGEVAYASPGVVDALTNAEVMDKRGVV